MHVIFLSVSTFIQVLLQLAIEWFNIQHMYTYLRTDLADVLVQDGNLVLDAVLLALQGFLGDALDGHQLLRPLLLR